MSKLLIICLLCAIFFLLTSTALAEKKEWHIKQGWNIIPFPIVSYNSDLGVQFGGSCDFFHFGSGTHYPDYLHKISVEASFYTKGSGVFRFFYDSENLIPHTRLTADISYLPDKMLPFYGFNGYTSPYIRRQPKGFYNMNRDMFRLTLDVQKRIGGMWSWMAGFGYYNYRMGQVKAKKYRDQISLYQHYTTLGVIQAKEARGGNVLQWKGGVSYDSRDIEGDPSRGFWGEVILCGSPDWIDRNGYDYLKLTTVFRHYVPIVNDRLTFAYRVGYQGTLAGKVPFYVQTNINTLYLRQTYSEGLGGTFSLRGILRNRIVGDGIAWLNTEFRYRFLHFNLFRQNWYFVINPFLDTGKVVKSFRANQLRDAGSPEVYCQDREKWHSSGGIGAKAVMNQNFVLSIEWGKAFDQRDGNNGFNLYMNFLF
ncbi:MAG: hypothetical protein RRY39_03750 [Odoribacter sp.]